MVIIFHIRGYFAYCGVPLHSSETRSTLWFDLCGEALRPKQDNEPEPTSKLRKNYVNTKDDQGSAFIVSLLKTEQKWLHAVWCESHNTAGFQLLAPAQFFPLTFGIFRHF